MDVTTTGPVYGVAPGVTTTSPVDACGLHILDVLSSVRKDVQEAATETHRLGNEIVSELHKQTINFNEQLFNQTLSLDKHFCDTEALIKDTQRMAEVAAKDSIIEGLKNTQAIKDTMKDDGEKTRTFLTNNKIEDLREALDTERRLSNRRENEIQINNVNTNTQVQTQAIASSLSAIATQLAHQTNSLVNLGTMVGSGTQSATNANTKVNS